MSEVFTDQRHPGVELREDYLEPAEIELSMLAMVLETDDLHAAQVLNGHADISVDIALKLERYFPQVPADYWVLRQARHALMLARSAAR